MRLKTGKITGKFPFFGKVYGKIPFFGKYYGYIPVTLKNSSSVAGSIMGNILECFLKIIK
jgi:hypothetical protein